MELTDVLFGSVISKHNQGRCLYSEYNTNDMR